MINHWRMKKHRIKYNPNVVKFKIEERKAFWGDIYFRENIVSQVTDPFVWNILYDGFNSNIHFKVSGNRASISSIENLRLAKSQLIDCVHKLEPDEFEATITNWVVLSSDKDIHKIILDILYKSKYTVFMEE